MPIPLYLLLINVATYGLYWLDKRAARNHGAARIPEYVLLGAGFFGGTLGALAAQHIVRHKNRKAAFQFKFWALTLIQIWLVVAEPIRLPV